MADRSPTEGPRIGTAPLRKACCQTVSSTLWAITPYFNPMGWRSRRENYRVFRERLAAPLIAVEFAWEGRFDLGPADADILVRVDRGDVMWQKERLLNLGLAHLPPDCRAVAWIDCDVVFDRQDWPLAALEQLQHVSLVQLFSTVRHLKPGHAPGTPVESADAVEQCSIVRAIEREGGLSACFENRSGKKRRYWSSGMAWAAQRELLEEHGLYDRCIVGGGDMAMVCAAFGMSSAANFHRMNSAQCADFERWALPFSQAVQGRAGTLEGAIDHLWHGSLGARRYLSRHERLAAFDLDPQRDVTCTPDSGLTWATPKPQLHQYLYSYLARRDEDGHPLGPTPNSFGSAQGTRAREADIRKPAEISPAQSR